MGPWTEKLLFPFMFRRNAPLLPLIFGSSPDKNSKIGRKFYYLEKLNSKIGRKIY